MWKKTIALTFVVTMLALTGCSPGSNSFSKRSQSEDGTSIQLAQLTSNAAKEQ